MPGLGEMTKWEACPVVLWGQVTTRRQQAGMGPTGVNHSGWGAEGGGGKNIWV